MNDTNKTSNEGTKYVLDLAVSHLNRLEVALENTKNATEFKVDVRMKLTPEQKAVEATKRYDERARFTMKEFIVTSVGKPVTVPDSYDGFKVLHFHEVKTNKIYDLERGIKGVKSDIKFFETKINEWKA